jgi:hypothetical protein
MGIGRQLCQRQACCRLAQAAAYQVGQVGHQRALVEGQILAHHVDQKTDRIRDLQRQRDREIEPHPFGAAQTGDREAQAQAGGGEEDGIHRSLALPGRGIQAARPAHPIRLDQPPVHAQQGHTAGRHGVGELSNNSNGWVTRHGWLIPMDEWRYDFNSLARARSASARIRSPCAS